MARDDTSFPSGTPRYASLRDYLKVIRQYRVLVVLVTLLGVGIAVAISVAQDPVYESEASLAFRPPSQDVELIGLPPVRDQTPEQRAAVGAEEANRPEVLEAVREKLRLERSLSDDVEARAEVRTNLVVIQAHAGDPVEAARIAQATAEEVVRSERSQQRKRLEDLIKAARREQREALTGDDVITRIERRAFEQQLAKLRATREFTSPVEIVEEAGVPSQPISPRPVRNAAIGLIAGLILALFLAFLRAALDRKLRDAGELAEESGLPLLAVVRKDALGRVNFGDVRGDDPDEEIDLEAFRILRMNLDYLDVDRPARRILVTSAVPEEGKSTVAASLAVAQGLAGRDVLLVGCDLRRPVLAERLGTESEPGLSDYLGGHARPEEVLRGITLGAPSANGDGTAPNAQKTMTFIPAGTVVPRPAELLGSQRFAGFVDEVSKAYERVVFDSAPLLSTADTLQLVEHVDAVVLCVRSESTTREQLRAALEALRRLPGRPTGLVVTGISPRAEGDYGYYSFTYSRPRVSA